MRTKEKPRKKILLNLDKKLLNRIDGYCLAKGYIRNKLLERIIKKQFDMEVKKNGI